MNKLCSAAILGIGSAHGDDQFGWAVIDRLAKMDFADVRLRKIIHPVDLIPELDTNESVLLVDAGVGLPRNVPFLKIASIDAADWKLVHDMPSRSTHNLGLSSTLRLAESLGKRTSHVTLWIGHGKSYEPMSDMSSSIASAAEDCAVAIAKELCDARIVAC
jgi:hydrogenase maturation protease